MTRVTLLRYACGSRADVGRDEGGETGREPGRDVGGDEGRDVGRDEGRDEGRDVGRLLGADEPGDWPHGIRASMPVGLDLLRGARCDYSHLHTNN